MMSLSTRRQLICAENRLLTIYGWQAVLCSTEECSLISELLNDFFETVPAAERLPAILHVFIQNR